MTSPEENDLPRIDTPLTPDQIRERLRGLSKQGKLPGYSGDEPGAVASVAAHGEPFDSRLLIHRDGDGVRFERRLRRTMPTVFVVLLIAAIWPGLPLTDDFLASFEWYASLMARIGIDTWHWYLPLTVLPLPFAYLGAVKKSRTTSHKSALEAIEKIRAALA